MPETQAKNGEMYRAGLPTLGARLLVAAGCVRPGHAVADIGCDHGKLAVWLAMKGVARRVIAVDNRPMPLARAKALVAQTGCGHVVECRLGDGLAALHAGEAEDIVIAGLSGETVCDIMLGCAWAQDAALRFVLVPTSHHERLRHRLCEAGFAIEAEVPVAENRRCYSVMTVGYTGEKRAPDALFCQLGLVAQAGGQAARGYVAARLAHLKSSARAPMDTEQRAAHERLTMEVQACLELLK